MLNYDQTSFVGDLFDLSFTRFISETLVRVLYLVTIVLAVIVVIVSIIAAFMNSLTYGISALILAPLFLFVYIVFARVLFEFVIVIFRIADKTPEIAENTKIDEDEK